jgi:hypothetical protein
MAARRSLRGSPERHRGLVREQQAKLYTILTEAEKVASTKSCSWRTRKALRVAFEMGMLVDNAIEGGIPKKTTLRLIAPLDRRLTRLIAPCVTKTSKF